MMTASSPIPVPNLNVMISGCLFLAVILMMESSRCLCFTLAQPALSESSRRAIRLSDVSMRWLDGGDEDGGDEESIIRNLCNL